MKKYQPLARQINSRLLHFSPASISKCSTVAQNGGNVFRVSNNLDPDETLSYSALVVCLTGYGLLKGLIMVSLDGWAGVDVGRRWHNQKSNMRDRVVLLWSLMYFSTRWQHDEIMRTNQHMDRRKSKYDKTASK